MQHSPTQKTKSLEQNSLKYLSIRAAEDIPSLSLDPKNSDQVDNHTILNTLVATLVKYGSSGKIEPYLASSWNISEDGKVWKFNLREGFSCESGLKITPQSFKDGLLASFRRNLKKSDTSDFNSLKGWGNFISKKSSDLDGITADENSISFIFEKHPAGLLNFLRMPYFGFWCPDNFTDDKFRLDGTFSSSGPYKLDRFISKSRVKVSMRMDQPSFDAEAPQQIEIGYGVLEELQNHDTPIIAKFIVDNILEISGYASIDGPPLIWQGIVLNPSSGFFSDQKNRHAFANRLQKFKDNNSSVEFSKGFYLTSRLDQDIVNSWTDSYVGIPKKEIQIAFQQVPFSSEKRLFWESLFKYVFQDIPYKIHFPDANNPDWVKKMLHDDSFDLRTANVYAGAHHNVNVIRMMFCSDLGISFPDPSKDICKLVQNYTDQNKVADLSFEKSFNEILVRDSSVLPLFHARDKLLVSNKIDFSTMPTSIIHPLFEKIRFR